MEIERNPPEQAARDTLAADTQGSAHDHGAQPVWHGATGRPPTGFTNTPEPQAQARSFPRNVSLSSTRTVPVRCARR